ncbi:DNA N(6)-methyladenine demethylase ALKBH1D-like [Henckelia pumila]|uniref:DNA N(6)-methyladenine demethylase ALKBH1D-like n=1 Tax=Henckelia pumila TaxID=405737 RepID=UPI003C6E8A3A
MNKIWVPKEQCDVANSLEETGQVLRPGMVLLKNYIPISEQVNIVKKCRELGLGPSGFYRPGYKDGAKLRLFMMCLGLDWDPQTRAYAQIRPHDNVVPPDIPSHFSSVVARSLEDSHRLIKKVMDVTDADDMLPKMSPDLCIVNFYTTNGRLGLHQDRDETDDSLRKGLPVVSMSIGDSAEFLYGNQRDVEKADSLMLESGDVLIFGAESRHIFHGVTNIFPRTAPHGLLEKTGLLPGRLNLTFRKY